MGGDGVRSQQAACSGRVPLRCTYIHIYIYICIYVHTCTEAHSHTDADVRTQAYFVGYFSLNTLRGAGTKNRLVDKPTA